MLCHGAAGLHFQLELPPRWPRREACRGEKGVGRIVCCATPWATATETPARHELLLSVLALAVQQRRVVADRYLCVSVHVIHQPKYPECCSGRDIQRVGTGEREAEEEGGTQGERQGEGRGRKDGRSPSLSLSLARSLSRARALSLARFVSDLLAFRNSTYHAYLDVAISLRCSVDGSIRAARVVEERRVCKQQHPSARRTKPVACCACSTVSAPESARSKHDAATELTCENWSAPAWAIALDHSSGEQVGGALSRTGKLAGMCRPSRSAGVSSTVRASWSRSLATMGASANTRSPARRRRVANQPRPTTDEVSICTACTSEPMPRADSARRERRHTVPAMTPPVTITIAEMGLSSALSSSPSLLAIAPST